MGWFGSCNEQNRILLRWALLRQSWKACAGKGYVYRLHAYQTTWKEPVWSLKTAAATAHPTSVTVWVPWFLAELGLVSNVEESASDTSGGTSMQGRLLTLHSGRQWLSICSASHNGILHSPKNEWFACIQQYEWIHNRESCLEVG